MLKYLVKVFDKNENLVIQTTVPAENMIDIVKELRQFGTVKCYILEGDYNV